MVTLIDDGGEIIIIIDKSPSINTFFFSDIMNCTDCVNFMYSDSHGFDCCMIESSENTDKNEFLREMVDKDIICNCFLNLWELIEK